MQITYSKKSKTTVVSMGTSADTLSTSLSRPNHVTEPSSIRQKISRQWLKFKTYIKNKPFLTATAYLCLDLLLRVHNALDSTARTLLRSIPVIAYVFILISLLKNFFRAEDDSTESQEQDIQLMYLITLGVLIAVNFILPALGTFCDILIAASFVAHNYAISDLHTRTITHQLHQEIASFSLFSAALMITMAFIPSLVIPLTAVMIISNILFMKFYSHHAKNITARHMNLEDVISPAGSVVTTSYTPGTKGEEDDNKDSIQFSTSDNQDRDPNQPSLEALGQAQIVAMFF